MITSPTTTPHRSGLQRSGALWALPLMSLPAIILLGLTHAPALLSALWLVSLCCLVLTPLAAGLIDGRWRAWLWVQVGWVTLMGTVMVLLRRADIRCLADPDCMSHSGILWVLLLPALVLYPVIAAVLFAIGRAIKGTPAPA